MPHFFHSNLLIKEISFLKIKSMAASKSKLSAKATADLMETLKERFLQNTGRHKSIEWKTVETTLKKHNAVLQAIAQMEETGGEPDVVTLK